MLVIRGVYRNCEHQPHLNASERGTMRNISGQNWSQTILNIQEPKKIKRAYFEKNTIILPKQISLIIGSK